MENRISLFSFPAVLAIILVLTSLSGASSQRGIVLNTADIPPNSTPDHRGISDRVLQEAFRRIGIPMRIVCLPSERALVNADEGADDGNFVRIKEIGAYYPNLVIVPESLVKFEFVVFSKRRDLRVGGWSGLKPYNVGIVRGWKILEANIRGTKSLTEVKDERILFGLLNSDRVDVAVYDRMQGLALLRELGYRGIHAIGSPLAVRDMYLHLNRRNVKLAPLIAGAIRGMKKDGSYRRIVRQVLHAYLAKGEVNHLVK